MTPIKARFVHGVAKWQLNHNIYGYELPNDSNNYGVMKGVIAP